MASEGVGTAPGQSAEVQLVSLLALFEELAYHNVVPNLLGPSMYPCTMAVSYTHLTLPTILLV